MKKYRRQLVLIVLCLFLVLTVLGLSHPCQGEDCPVCACLHQLLLGLCLVSVFLLWTALAAVQSAMGSEAPVFTKWAFAFQKVRLNN